MCHIWFIFYESHILFSDNTMCPPVTYYTIPKGINLFHNDFAIRELGVRVICHRCGDICDTGRSPNIVKVQEDNHRQLHLMFRLLTRGVLQKAV